MKQASQQPEQGHTSPSAAQSNLAHAGAEYGEAGDPGDEAASAARSPGYSGSLQARSGAQGQVTGRSSREVQHQAMLPPVDIFEDDTGVTLLADLPGVTREGLSVRVDGENLLIEGRAEVPEVGEMELVHGELLHPSYRRSFTLSRDLDAQRIEAQLKDGVLRLRIHKAEQAKPRRIEVQAG